MPKPESRRAGGLANGWTVSGPVPRVGRVGSAAARAARHRIRETTRIRKINALSQLYRLTAALRHNCDLVIARLTHYLLHNCFLEPFPPGAGAVLARQELGPEMGARELSDGARHVLTF